MALPIALKWNLTVVDITLAIGVQTGSSAANPDLAKPSFLASVFPTGVATTTGWGLVDSCTLNADGSVTVTTRAVVATANLTVRCLVATPSNAG